MPDPNLFSDGDIIVCYGRGEAHQLTDKHLASTIHCIDDEIFAWLERRERRRRHRHVRCWGVKRKTYARIELFRDCAQTGRSAFEAIALSGTKGGVRGFKVWKVWRTQYFATTGPPNWYAIPIIPMCVLIFKFVATVTVETPGDTSNSELLHVPKSE
jgi:hypothetical protein